ncbi:MAG: AAA family ATPase [Nitrospirae bacterium]|uniref:AAA family ATPase n=1 Tax=Candidatus Magnetobacterium casense TaxID=1455061 RepID=UPI00058C2632|nr:AAA family ATPase [Candidatus Magnetobacterium casensis]MBF0338255.1 AAA family ATPase [Nitrospirota bacterium]
MKILKVRLKNLNSLMGQWVIDFTHPAYANSGIFVITGPTGAGKTTILDAICLALYGRTPRLGKVTKGANEIMSRQGAECMAEVVFETQEGTFMCHWSQHRARMKYDGELQSPRHEISDAKTGRLIETKLRDVAGQIEKKTGMDFDRFTRSMLLAQGGFAAFLQAPPDERSPILEQITGTEIYSRISMTVHERWQTERDKLRDLKATQAGIQLMSNDEAQQLHIALEQTQTVAHDLSSHIETLRGALTWLEGISALQGELTTLEQQWQLLMQRQQVFEPELMRLDRAMRALSVQGDYVKTVALLQEYNKLKKDLDDALSNLPLQETALNASLQQRETAQERLQQARSAQMAQAEVIKTVRELDTRIVDKRTLMDASTKAITEVQRQQQICSKRITQGQESLKKSQVALQEIENYLSDHATDARLVEDLAGIKKTFETIRHLHAANDKATEAHARTSGERDAAITECSTAETRYETSRDALSVAQQQHSQLTEAVNQLLGGRETGQWRLELDTLRQRKTLIEQTALVLTRINAATKTLEELRRHHDTLKTQLSRLVGEIEVKSVEQVRLQQEVNHLEREVMLLSRIHDLEAERKRLEDGKPCPLCGATEHPYARGNVPAIDEVQSAQTLAREALKDVSALLTDIRVRRAGTEKDISQVMRDSDKESAALRADQGQCSAAFVGLGIESASGLEAQMVITQRSIDETSAIIKDVEQKEKQQKALQKKLDAARTSFNEADKALQQTRHRHQMAERDLKRLEVECATLAEQLSVACNGALTDVTAYGITEVSVRVLKTIEETLTRRRDTWQVKQAKREAIQRDITTINADLETQRTLVVKLDEELQVRGVQHNELAVQIEQLSAQRSALYGIKVPDEEEKRYAEAVAEAERSLEQARQLHGGAQEAVNTLKARIASLGDAIGGRTEELTVAQQGLRQRLVQAGFVDEQDYQAACMTDQQRQQLSQRKESLQREQTELETRRRDKDTALSVERDKAITDQSHDVLQEEALQCQVHLKEAQQKLGGIRQQLLEDEVRQTRYKEHLAVIESQQREFLRWDALHDLIGSADGKKYRNFVQGLTFEVMVSHANSQLQNMTDRYLLVRSDVQPLELNVIDSYQGGEVRSTKNLSGGEGFIVSLALALGLSGMASRNVRIDSLFLDEGFGTLDEDALETAIETLAQLQQEGKVIGIISHVAVLKERFSTQVQVIPRSGGRSTINGPGCSRA